MLERESKVPETLIRENYFAQAPVIRCAEAADHDSVEAIMQEGSVA